jgi:ABC-type branched-subunit amino acid transport system ATPase component
LSDRSYVMEKGRIVAAIPEGGVNADAVRRHLML